MATQFQNRLVGTLILVSLGVIFLPDVFDGEKAHYEESYQAIPLREEVDESLLTEPVMAPEEVESFMPPEEPVVVTIDAPAAPNVASAPKENYTDSAWIIRLGTFRNIENAHNLVATLRSKGYAAQLMPRDIKEGELARVEVGPDVSKEKLESMTADLESLTGLKGQLLRFNPLNP
ncbi:MULTISPECIES: SPOR domain-containing protein [Grimontia]|uniref:Cell division protein DedD n=1 Tax=Grimontia marina TaxID=646534 RepID=A0A128ET62_9GAMM|nr:MULTISPECIES: SPOR domain-containing protein [Grimontia]WRV97499.1 SPOR domain-containing protein [Grimontia sp. NTOU-MAR1]CZF77295.1 cell division protein DedD [Grimontia marina]